MSWKIFFQRIGALIVVTACITAVLLFMAQNPSGDEFTKGGAAGLVGYFATKLFCKN